MLVASALALSGCGTGVPEISEVWDQFDPEATQHMEMQIKQAIFCELRDAVYLARETYIQKEYQGEEVTSKEDQPVPDSWEAQITLTFTVDEASKFNPGVSLITPMHNAPVNFVGETIGATGVTAAHTFGPLALSQSYAFGLGGTLSSEANRVDKFETFYTIGDLINVLSEKNVCNNPNNDILGPKSASSPFLVNSNLGIKRWLPEAASVSAYLRSSRQNPSGEGPPLGSAGSFAADSFSYDIKFIVTTDINATPMWKRVRVAAPIGPTLFDTNRMRTHDLLITVGPGETKEETTKEKTKKGVVTHVVTRTVGPSQSAVNSHQAQEIGNAVAAALALAPSLRTQ
jgi:hypothetical protein